MKLLIFSVTLSFCLTHAGIGAIIVDLASDFSATSNPNGEWRYVNSDDGTATNISTQRSDSALSGWSNAANFDGSVMEITNADAASFTWNDGQNGDIVLHSSENFPTKTGVIWTAAEAGVIDIKGKAWDAYHDTGRDSAWELYLNDTLLASRSSIFGVGRIDNTALFSNNIVGGASLESLSVSIGDTVSFYTTAPTTNFGHFTGVELSIIPEPKAYSLLLGMLALCVVNRRSSRI